MYCIINHLIDNTSSRIFKAYLTDNNNVKNSTMIMKIGLDHSLHLNPNFYTSSCPKHCKTIHIALKSISRIIFQKCLLSGNLRIKCKKGSR